MADKDNLQKILEKLRKLMNLKDSAEQCGQEGEAHAAAAGITRLLREYDLTLEDIPQEVKPKDPVDIQQVPFRFTYMQYKWYWLMMDVLAGENGCQIIRTRSFSGKRCEETVYQVVGRSKNREVVLYLISFCAHRFLSVGQRKYREWRLQYIKNTGKTPPAVGLYLKSFLMGCVAGLRDKLERERETLSQDRLSALVLRQETEIKAFMQGMDVKTTVHRKMHVDGDVYLEGCDVGRNIRLLKGVGGVNGQMKVIE